jgi:glycosyltransferase involved in cell wall biosynthesis
VVVWRGFTDPAVERAMRAAAAVVLPSSYAEGVPRTLIEAAAAGAPIITDTPGCRDTVIDQVSGFLCALGAPAELAAVMARLLDEPHLIVDMGRAGRALAVARFNRRIVIEQTVSLYEEQLRRARR